MKNIMFSHFFYLYDFISSLYFDYNNNNNKNNKNKNKNNKHSNLKNIRLFNDYSCCILCFLVIFLGVRSNEWKENQYNQSIIRNHSFSSENFIQNNTIMMISSLSSHRNLEWIGQQWYPPNNGHLYNFSEIADEMIHRCTLFIGDSLTRRFGAQVAYIVNHRDLDPDHIDRTDVNLFVDNKTYFHQYSLRKYTKKTKCLDFYWNPKLRDLTMMMKHDMSGREFKKYNTIILGIGIHDTQNCIHLNESGWKNTLRHCDEMIQFICHDLTWNSYRIYVWRLAPYFWGTPASDAVHTLYVNNRLEEFNNRIESAILNYCNRKILVLNHMKLLKPVSIGELRLSGNTREHFDLEARLASVQSFIHELKHFKVSGVGKNNTSWSSNTNNTI